MELLRYFVFVYRKLGIRLLSMGVLTLVGLVAATMPRGDFLQSAYTNHDAIQLIHDTGSIPSYVETCEIENGTHTSLNPKLPRGNASIVGALLYWKRGECISAQTELISLLNQAPDHFSGWYWLGIVAASLDDPIAISAFQESGATPRVVSLAERAFEKGDIQQTAMWLRIAAQIRTLSPLDIYRVAWKYYEQGDRQSALDFLRPYYDVLPHDSIDSLRTAGMIERIQGHIAEAIRYYEQGLQRAPADLDFLYRLRSTYMDTGDYERALNIALTEATHTPPIEQKQAEIRLVIAQIFRLKGETLQALDWAQAAIDASPNWRAAYTELGIIYCSTGQVSLALENHEKALSLAKPSDSLPAFVAKARCLYDSGDIEAGIATMEMLMRGFGNDSRLISSYQILSQWHVDNGERNEAEEVLRSGLTLWPNASSLRSALDKLKQP